MPRRGGDALSKLASQGAHSDRPEIPRKLGFSLDDAMNDLGSVAAQPDEQNVSGPDLDSIDPSTLSPDMKLIYDELRETKDALVGDRSRIAKEGRKLRSSHHAAGLLDSETVDKAQMFDALMSNPALLQNDPRFAALRQQNQAPEESDADLQKIIGDIPEENAKAIMALAKKAILNDPAFKAKVDRLDALEAQTSQAQRAKNQSELNDAIGKMESLGYDPQEIIDAEAAQQIIAMRQSPSFAKLSMGDIIQRVTGINLKAKRSRNDETPPMQRGSSARSSANQQQPKTRSIHEAGKRVLERMRKER